MVKKGVLKMMNDKKGLAGKTGWRHQQRPCQEKNMEQELEELILSSYKMMYRMAFTYMRQEQDAMDIVQESILKALKYAGHVKEREHLKTWLFRILINTALDELEKRKKTIPLLADCEEGKEDIYEDMDILNALNRLDEQEKAIITLRYFEEWKIEDISVLMEKNINTVKSVLYRGLRKMKVELMKGEII